MLLQRFYTYAAILWTALITLSCLIPPSGLQNLGLDALFQFDKLLHLFIFTVLTLLWGQTKQHFRTNLSWSILLVLCSSFFGYLIELTQQLAWIGRSFEWADLVADTLGSALGVILLRFGPDLNPYVKKRLPFIK